MRQSKLSSFYIFFAPLTEPVSFARFLPQASLSRAILKGTVASCQAIEAAAGLFFAGGLRGSTAPSDNSS